MNFSLRSRRGARLPGYRTAGFAGLVGGGSFQPSELMLLGSTSGGGLTDPVVTFLFGVSVPVIGLLLLLWALYRDPRYPALALLLVMVVFEFVMQVRETVAPVTAAWLSVGFTAAVTLVLCTHYPLLFCLPRMGRILRRSWRYRAAVGRLHPDASAHWHRGFGLFVLGCLAVLGVALGLLPLLPVPEELSARGLDYAQYTPALLALPVSVVLGRTFRLRRPAVFLGLLLAVVLVAFTGVAMATGVALPGVRFPLWGGLLALALGQLVGDVYHDVQTAEKDRNSIRALHHTVRQRANDLKDLMVRAQAANLAKTQFVSSVSHELRTPLTAISGYAQILLEELPEGNSLQEEFLGIIRQSCERLKSLINDLLDMAKVESGRVELKIASVELEPVLREVTAQLHPLAETKGLQLLRPRIDVPEPVVHADPLRLRQVLINLLSNAIKFTESGCVGIYVSPATIEGYQGTGHRETAIAVEVFDTGIGISESFLEQLFEPFTQDERAYSSTQQGTGLGLSITKELVERMGGAISVMSVVGEGTTFRVLLAQGVAGASRRRKAAGHAERELQPDRDPAPADHEPRLDPELPDASVLDASEAPPQAAVASAPTPEFSVPPVSSFETPDSSERDFEASASSENGFEPSETSETGIETSESSGSGFETLDSSEGSFEDLEAREADFETSASLDSAFETSEPTSPPEVASPPRILEAPDPAAASEELLLWDDFPDDAEDSDAEAA